MVKQAGVVQDREPKVGEIFHIWCGKWLSQCDLPCC